MDVHHYECTEQFITAEIADDSGKIVKMWEAVEPEHKRKMIGDTFIRCKDRAVDELKLDADMGHPSPRSHRKKLGLPGAIVNSHPFPGPGLAIRIICTKHPFMCADFASMQERLTWLCNLSKAPSKAENADAVNFLKHLSDDEVVFLQKQN